jgi:membrane protease YdiL (CAAX protease family)
MSDASDARPAVLPTIVGLSVALGGPFLVQFVLAPLMLQSSVGSSSAVLLSQSMLWLLTGTVIVVTRWWEHRPWSWIGVRRISWRAALLAAVLGVALGIAVPILTLATSRLLPLSKGGGTVDRVAASGPAWLVLAVVLTASVTEEFLFRAYPIERLTRLTGARWPGALLSLAAFVAFHVHGWPLGYVLGVVLPLGAVMTGGRCHDRPLPVAAQPGIRNHHPFLA